jgi:hypothetical protein
MSLKDQILAANDTKIEKLHVPEWGVDVYIRTLTGFEGDAFDASTRDSEGNRIAENFTAKYCQLVMCDETGAQVFGPGDLPALSQKSNAALNRVFNAGLKLNRMSAEGIEEAEKNSEKTTQDDSGSS